MRLAAVAAASPQTTSLVPVTAKLPHRMVIRQKKPAPERVISATEPGMIAQKGWLQFYVCLVISY